MSIHEQVEFIIGENYKLEYLNNPDYYEDEIEELKNDLFNNYKDNQFDFDNDDIVETLPKLFDYYDYMTTTIVDCLREKDYDKLYNLYALMVYTDIVMDMEQQHNKKIEKIETDFKELFENTGEEIYIRNCKIDNGITERFKNIENKHIIAYINTEETTTDKPNLEYYTAYGGSKEFNKLLVKYNLMFEWETNCIACLYFDDDDDDDDDDDN